MILIGVLCTHDCLWKIYFIFAFVVLGKCFRVKGLCEMASVCGVVCFHIAALPSRAGFFAVRSWYPNWFAILNSTPKGKEIPVVTTSGFVNRQTEVI